MHLHMQHMQNKKKNTQKTQLIDMADLYKSVDTHFSSSYSSTSSYCEDHFPRKWSFPVKAELKLRTSVS